MLKKVISYTDYNGNVREEPFYFNLTEAELTELELTHPGGYGEYIQRIAAANEQAELVKLFKELIAMSYGVKSDDGKRFRKSKEISQEFFETEAYSILFMELATDDVKAAEFVNGIMPKSLMERVEASETLEDRTRKLIEEKKASD